MLTLSGDARYPARPTRVVLNGMTLHAQPGQVRTPL